MRETSSLPQGIVRIQTEQSVTIVWETFDCLFVSNSFCQGHPLFTVEAIIGPQ